MEDKNHKKSDKKNHSQDGELQTQINELKAGWQRTQADFENARRRWEEERKNLTGSVKLVTLLEFAPVLDNFERAFANAPEDSTWLQGFKAIKRQIEDIYLGAGLKKVGDINEEFNPSRHEAISYIDSNDCASEHVCQVVEYGWELDGKILKPAKVVVAK